jgi:hypothetical protein
MYTTSRGVARNSGASYVCQVLQIDLGICFFNFPGVWSLAAEGGRDGRATHFLMIQGWVEELMNDCFEKVKIQG